MPYQIKCDDFVLYDVRDEDLTLKNPKCKLAVNTVGEASFTILANHPCYNELQKMRSIFEIRQNNEPIFRGRMTDDSKDFHNKKEVDLEGVMAFFNDSIIRPFVFPDDFLNYDEYREEAAEGGNVVRFLLRWFIDIHNSQVEPFQQFKLGRVTVSDPNNTIVRSSEDYQKTWEAVKKALFDSSLGGYLCIRYEADGNYIDYLADFTDESGERLRNSQKIVYGENLLDIQKDSDATETYSAIIPLGQGENNTILTIQSLDDKKITSDIVKVGDTLYSISAVEKYGWIYAPVSETTWEDVTVTENLQTKGVNFLQQNAIKIRETVTITAVDLNLADSEIEAFRIYRYIGVESQPHDHTGEYPLAELDIDIDNPQNTKITVGESKRVLTDKTNNIAHKVDNIQKHYAKNEVVYNEILRTRTLIEQTDKKIRLYVAQDYVSTTEFEKYKGTASAEIALKIGRNEKNEVIGMINIVSNQITIQSDYFTLSADGTITAMAGKIGDLNLSGGELMATDSVYTTIIGANRIRTERKDEHWDRSAVLRNGRLEIYLNSSQDNVPVFGGFYWSGQEYVLMLDKDNEDANGHCPLKAVCIDTDSDGDGAPSFVQFNPTARKLSWSSRLEAIKYNIYFCISQTAEHFPDYPEPIFYNYTTGITAMGQLYATQEGLAYWGVSAVYDNGAGDLTESEIAWDKENYSSDNNTGVPAYVGVTFVNNTLFPVTINRATPLGYGALDLSAGESVLDDVKDGNTVYIRCSQALSVTLGGAIVHYENGKYNAYYVQTGNTTLVTIDTLYNFTNVEFINNLDMSVSVYNGISTYIIDEGSSLDIPVREGETVKITCSQPMWVSGTSDVIYEEDNCTASYVHDSSKTSITIYW